MPTIRSFQGNSHSENGNGIATKRRSSSRRNRSHSIAAEANRHVIAPATRVAKRTMKTARRKVKRTLLGLPAWMPWAAAAVAATGLIYAIVRSEAVQDFFDDMGNSDTFGEEEDYRSDGYEGADYGESGAGGL